ncbi:hypothetical protein PRZ48_002928 [Zasmidium cellare]|uniref:Mitochondrial intermembrane space import and assembly protein 40 n=1 Tax=Zasmidium cellare TaxID=395010 RepID=A0ABR0EU29_ZASCE|nr:hypothetical protein PRZ48_002928 [Zasmidium cellare]
MFRPAFRAATVARAIPKAPAGRRFASTTASKSGTWRGAALRWGAAGAIVYYYNTSSVFAEEPQYAVHAALETPHESEHYNTVDSIAERRRARARSTLQQSQEQTPAQEIQPNSNEQVAVSGDAAGLEEEAEQQGAFNEETGEINWDCPCLGGMAYGPCGEQFRAAFSCFVYSKEEPKGVDCIEHFKTMQNCFREHPELYGSELDEEEVDAQIAEDAKQVPPTESQPAPAAPQAAKETAEPERQRVKAATEQVKRDNLPLDESDEILPKAWHDSRESNTAK